MSITSDIFYDKIVTSIKKPPNERTIDEIEEICPWFVGKIKFFSNLKSDIVKDIIKNCEFSERDTDDIIIRQFEEGDCFYIILSGQVSIYVNTELVHDDQEVVHQQDEFVPAVKHSVERKATNREKCGNYVVSFGTGASFGELALINKDCIRNATVIADRKTHLAVINRATYNRSLKDVHEADFKKRIEFINKCPLFNGWIQSLKKQAAMSLVQTDFPFEANLVRQEEPVNGLLFIISGQAQVSVDILKHPKQYPNLKLAAYSVTSTEMDDHKLIHTENPNYPVRRMGYIVNERRSALKKIDLCIIGPGTILGEFEYGFNLKTYVQTAICIEPTSAYILGGRNFERLIQSRRNPDGLKQIREIAERNILYRINRPIDSKIPLFRCLVKQIYEANLQLQEEQREKALANRNKIKSVRIKGLFEPTSRNQKQQQQERMKGSNKSLLQQNEPEFQTRRHQIDKLQNNILTLRTRKYSANQIEERNTKSNSANKRFNSAYSGFDTVYGNNNSDFNEPTTDRLNNTELNEKLPSFSLYDWETSSENISLIEGKLKRWHYEVDMLHDGETSVGNRISSLKSCEQINLIKQPLPGKQIFIRTIDHNSVIGASGLLETNQFQADNTMHDSCKSVRFESSKRKIDSSEVFINQDDDLMSPNLGQVKITTLNVVNTTDDQLVVDEAGEEYEFKIEVDKSEAFENADEKNQNLTNEVKLILDRIRPVSSTYGYISTNRSSIPTRNIKSARTDEIKESELRKSVLASSRLSTKNNPNSYTVIREYRELRDRLRKQENDMRRFRVSLLL
ncbi:unnamed protein product [Schistosoma margrebowiei]|uniref:Cyclic nucleotide-binding domain-containing protein n=1 Tax=Schistosoma margrebowiei TaxID=48269 RepID=A0AA84ZV67_9TREM|nr:unnamed protein product [Schistosoma margrebowiei]